MVKLYIRDKDQMGRLLAEKGYSQKSLSKRVNIVPTYMSAIINGKSSVGKTTAGKIASRLNVEITDIFFITVVDKSYTERLKEGDSNEAVLTRHIDQGSH